MKKWQKVLLLIIIILMVLILISIIPANGRLFWKEIVVFPILKPFSEPCGYSGTSGMRVDCECDGILISKIAKGGGGKYCTGSCGECKCYTYNFSTGIETEVDCTTLAKLSWAFPLK